MKVFVIYTDGACIPNPGLGGWGWVQQLECGSVGLSGSGSEENTTNNRMEYRAAIEAIRYFCHELNDDEKSSIEIRTDSQLLVNTCSEWIYSWEAKNWPKRIKNLDLVKELYYLIKSYSVKFSWVKGHNGDEFNEIADELANKAVENHYYPNIKELDFLTEAAQIGLNLK